MDQFVARSNIDHYLELLNSNDTLPDRRATLTRLLVEEVDKLARETEHLDFVEAKLASCRDIVERQRQLVNRLALGSTVREEAERALANFTAVLRQVEHFGTQLRARIGQRM